MPLRPLRISFVLLALLLAAGCSRGDDSAALDDLPIDDTGLIATFDVGYEVPLDIPEDLQDSSSETNRGDSVVVGDDANAGEGDGDNDPPDGLAMADEGSEEPAAAAKAMNEEEATSTVNDPNLRDDGLLYVRSPVFEDGRWKSIALLAPDGDVMWSYNSCDDSGCTHDDILVLPNGNVAVTATSSVDGRLVDNVLELEPVIGDACASDDWCTGVARHSRLDLTVPEGFSGAITLLSAADDYSSWDVLSIADGATMTIPAL